MKAILLIAITLSSASAHAVLAQSGQIAYDRKGEIWVYDIASKKQTQVTPTAEFWYHTPVLAKGGRSMIFRYDGPKRDIKIQRAQRDDKGEWTVDPTPLVKMGGLAMKDQPRDFALSPDGEWLAYRFLTGAGVAETNALRLYSFDTKKETQVLPSGTITQAYSPAWVSNEKLAVVADTGNYRNKIYIIERQKGLWKLNEKPLPGEVAMAELEATSDGKFLLVCNVLRDGEKFLSTSRSIFNLQNGQTSLLPNARSSSFSPDGRWLISNTKEAEDKFSLWEKTGEGQYKRTDSTVFATLRGNAPSWSTTPTNEGAISTVEGTTEPQSIETLSVKENEILLSGRIISKSEKFNRIVISAEEFVLPNTKSGAIKPAKLKTLLVTPTTFMHFAGKTEKVALGALPIGGHRIQVVGTDSGSGQPLKAREIIVSLTP